MYRTFFVANCIWIILYIDIFSYKVSSKRDIYKKGFWPPFFQDGGQIRSGRGVQNEYVIKYSIMKTIKLIAAFHDFFLIWPFFLLYQLA